jgi:hypothetical protein
MPQPQKKLYEKPQLTRHGKVEDFTQQTAPGPSQIVQFSDRNLKANFAAVEVQSVLEKLAQVPVSTWNYKSDFANIRHMGPMAQDFARAFGLGNSDRVIHSVDSGGVSMAAIQALYQMALEQNQRIAALEAEVRELRQAAMAV